MAEQRLSNCTTAGARSRFIALIVVLAACAPSACQLSVLLVPAGASTPCSRAGRSYTYVFRCTLYLSISPVNSLQGAT